VTQTDISSTCEFKWLEREEGKIIIYSARKYKKFQVLHASFAQSFTVYSVFCMFIYVTTCADSILYEENRQKMMENSERKGSL